MTDHYGGASLTAEQERDAWRGTYRVLDEVAAERGHQRVRYGLNRDLQDGTGRPWNGTGYTAAETEQHFRSTYELYEEQHGRPTWMHLVREEVAEAFAETDPVRLRAELLQVAALCVSWVETLDAR